MTKHGGQTDRHSTVTKATSFGQLWPLHRHRCCFGATTGAQDLPNADFKWRPDFRTPLSIHATDQPLSAPRYASSPSTVFLLIGAWAFGRCGSRRARHWALDPTGTALVHCATTQRVPRPASTTERPDPPASRCSLDAPMQRRSELSVASDRFCTLSCTQGRCVAREGLPAVVWAGRCRPVRKGRRMPQPARGLSALQGRGQRSRSRPPAAARGAGGRAARGSCLTDPMTPDTAVAAPASSSRS